MHSRFRLFMLTIAIAISCSTFSSFAAHAQTSTSSLNPDISSLETRFFDHTYPSESTDDRLGRLEKMVFGEAKTGSDQARLTALLTAVPEDPAPASASSAQSSQAPNAQPSLTPETASAAPANSMPPTAPQASPQYSDNSASAPLQPGEVAPTSDYPRITQLEQEILGKTFTNEPVQQRLEQLELKAFGKASSTQDLSDRTDALESYADQRFPHQNYPATADGGFSQGAPSYQPPSYGQAPAYSPTAYNQSSGSPAVSPKATLDQKVTWLEKQVFNKTYSNEPLLDRVKRLATNIFPTDSPQLTQSLADQVSSMIGAVELNHPGAATGPAIAQAPQQETMPPFSQPAYDQQSSQFNQSSYPNYNQNYASQNQAAQAQAQPQQKPHSKSLLNGLAHVLGTVGQMAAGSMMGGYGGMGGMGGMGMPFTW